jgi:DsbC/DsbD-like thiol-disulfide interchange protein
VGVPGKAAGEVNAGIEIELAEGWKTYWRMPGDAGVPPTFEWTGSRNAAAITVSYPAPTRLPEPAAETIGYKKHVLFPVAAKAASPGAPVSLTLEVEIGICKDICVPAQAAMALDLPAASQTGPLPEPLADALRRVPVPATAAVKDHPVLVSATARLGEAPAQLQVIARFPGSPEAADLFIEAPESIYVPMSKRTATAPDGSLTFTVSLPPGTAQDLKGKTLTLTLVGATGATEARWQLP